MKDTLARSGEAGVYDRPRLCSGFSLVELLVVITIVVLLVALLLPSLQHARHQAKIGVCTGQLRQVAVGLRTYTADNRNWYPSAQDPRMRFNYLSTNDEDLRPTLAYYYDDPELSVFTCPLVDERFPGGLPSSAQTSYAVFPNAFGRGAISGLTGAAYETTLASVDHERLMKKVGDTYTLNTNSSTQPKFSIIAGDISKYWQFGPIIGPVLNHFPPGTNYGEAHPYTSTRAWSSATAAGSANFAREDGSVKLFSGITRANRKETLYYDRYNKLGLPIAEAR